MARVRSGRLALAIFLVALVAVLAAVGLPALLTVAGLTPRASDTAAATLGRGHAALATAEGQRLERLALSARLLAREGALIGVLGGASGAAGEVAIDGAAALADLLAQRRPELGFDLALVLDTEGRVLGAAEGSAVAVGSDLASDPLVAVALAEGAAAGTSRAGSELAHVAVEPVAPDFDLLGYLLVGAALDEVFALEVGRTSGAGVTLVAATGDGTAEVLASSVGRAEAAALTGAVAAPGGAVAAVLRGGGATEETTVDGPAGARRVMVVPLASAGSAMVAAALLSAPAASGGPAALLPLGAAAALGLLFALLLAPFVARRTLAPAVRLVEVVDAAPRESFARRLDPRRYRTLAPLAAALDRLFRILQEERSLVAAVAGALRARRRAAVHAGLGEAAAAAAPVAEAGAVVVFELRRHARLAGDPLGAARELADDLDRLRQAVTAAGGRLAACAGHRALAAFAGESAPWTALAAAAVALAELAAVADATNEGEPAAAAVASGRLMRADGGSGVLTGPAVALAETVLRETSAGELAMTRAVHRTVGEQLAGHGIVASEQRGLLSPQPLFVVPATAVATLAGAVRPPSSAAAGAAGPAAGSRFAGRHQVLVRQGASRGAELWRLRPSQAGGGTALKWMPDPDPAALRELRSLDGSLERVRRCEHPGLAAIGEVGEAGGGIYLVREWIDGVPLAELGELTVPAAMALARQLAAAVAALHRDGLAHGRIKPENVVLEVDGSVRLVDQGVAAVAGAAPSTAAGDHLLAAGERRVEAAGGEAPAGLPVDARADVYALGALIQRLVIGSWPGEDRAEAATVAPPDGLSEVLARALAKEPDARYRDAGELAGALEGIAA